MHNRVGGSVSSREISLLDGAVLAPLVAVILFLAFYPQFALHRSEGAVKASVAAASRIAGSAPSRLASLSGAKR
jgi:NADH:ubiquinone oxidoreductase subunit 4 (subunit M)